MKIQLNARNCSHQFDAAPAEKILHAGLSSAISLPYECGSGTCGTCRARLLSGEIDDAWPEAPGRKYLKAADEFLMCQCTVRGDVALEVTGFVDALEPDVFVPAAVAGRIRQTRMLTHDVMSLRVEIDRPMDFDAGQFVLLRVPGIAGFRGWSMVNHERGTSVLEFVVKKKPGGALSEWLFAERRADIPVDVYGPLGSATFQPSLARNVVCIAGGSGIAGMMSILARAAKDDYFRDYRGDVFFGVRTMKDAFYLDELSRLRERCGEQLSVTIALSEEAAPATSQIDHPLLQFDQGYVHEVAGRRMKGKLQGSRAYLAGPAPAVDASVRMLLMSRVSTDNIRYDKFS